MKHGCQEFKEKEERAWDLVEKFISGEASGREFLELRNLLSADPALFASVKEFLGMYKDPDPQVTEEDKQALLAGQLAESRTTFFRSGATSPVKPVSYKQEMLYKNKSNSL